MELEGPLRKALSRPQKGWRQEDVHGKNTVETFRKGKSKAETDRWEAHWDLSLEMLPGLFF